MYRCCCVEMEGHPTDVETKKVREHQRDPGSHRKHLETGRRPLHKVSNSLLIYLAKLQIRVLDVIVERPGLQIQSPQYTKLAVLTFLYCLNLKKGKM